MFTDRVDAGRQLAERLRHLAWGDVVVLGLPRGGVPVAAEVARVLGAPLDVIMVRKLGVPFQRELAMGAIGEDGVRVLSREVVEFANVDSDEIAAVERSERAELERRTRRFRAGRPRVSLNGRVAVVVDDGIATGATAKVACEVARLHGAVRVVLAVPVAPRDWTERLRGAADEYVCVETPASFGAVGAFYRDFSQVSDDEVVATLGRSQHGAQVAAPLGDELVPVAIDVDGATVRGDLGVPASPIGVVVFAHGSGSSRHSPRNRLVAANLREAGLATLLIDLLTTEEEVERSNVFDIDLLAQRLLGAVRWVRASSPVAGLPIGIFGASTGAAAALWAAAEPSADVAAVVSRGGRPDLAGERLGDVRAPTLLIVGDRDRVVLDLNRRAEAQMHAETELATVPGATHLFEEPGALRIVAELARDWFVTHLTAVGAGRSVSSGA